MMECKQVSAFSELIFIIFYFFAEAVKAIGLTYDGWIGTKVNAD